MRACVSVPRRCTIMSAKDPSQARTQRIAKVLKDVERTRASRLQRTGADIARGVRATEAATRELLAAELRDVSELARKLAAELGSWPATTGSISDDDYDA